MNEEIGYFKRSTIPLLKLLVKKRWLEGKPLCIEDIPSPVEQTVVSTLLNCIESSNSPNQNES